MYQILVVDDERIERNGIKMLLRHMQLPCEIAEAANGRDALEYLKDHTADILLTDVKMPFMDGIQLIEECKKDDRNEDMKCVIFSGCSEFDYARKAVRLGVSDYILKPVDPSEFKETITRVIQELEAERAEKNMKKKSMQQMREHALYQIVNGVNVAEVLEKSGGVLTKSDVDCFCRILMLETDDDFFGKNGVDLQERILAKKMKEVCDSEAFLYLNLTPQQSIILLKDRFIDEKKGIEYIRKGDFYFPNLVDSASVNKSELGKYGKLRLKYLLEHKKVEYTILWLDNKLRSHLLEIDKTANERFHLLMKQFAEQENITEELKATNQMEWVRCMNNIKNRVEEIIFKELIYV